MGDNTANLEAELGSQVVTVDPGGEVFTAYIFGDNYFELFINSTYICRDTERFTPFNSHAVRFVAQPPLSIGVIGVDWEEQAGVDLETGCVAGGFQIGDARLILEVNDSTGAVVVAPAPKRPSKCGRGHGSCSVLACGQRAFAVSE